MGMLPLDVSSRVMDAIYLAGRYPRDSKAYFQYPDQLMQCPGHSRQSFAAVSHRWKCDSRDGGRASSTFVCLASCGLCPGTRGPHLRCPFSYILTYRTGFVLG